MLKKYKKQMAELGLTEKESSVYLALMELGTATADQIAKDADLNRSTTYVQIEKLLTFGLISKFKDGKKTKFSAESPSNLNIYLKSQKEAVRRKEDKATVLIPELLDYFNQKGNQAEVRYFEGVDGLRAIRNEILEVKSKEYYAAASIDNMQKLFKQKELDKFSRERKRKKITVYLLFTYSGTPDSPVGDQHLQQIDQEKFPFSSDVYIFDDKVAFANTDGRVGGVIITSPQIAETMRSIMKLAWSSVTA